ncbi:hemolysin family protein [Entomospira nematocerorum]|uniref:HlyC/CorC family transporter n=1 Tax=Entomospira nematocerorum TaxID=2719987 RepID=A0A968KV03_9SPIO|nr:hemolysin family protein [Entomospira nematocera]NIZ46713.1 HlyC/CorC family transporter [Entomospira nematocera]WDI33491.1 hemolysin family protein [Entomospira nematocera]
MLTLKNWLMRKSTETNTNQISAEKEKMIQGILSLEETTAAEVMVPRVDGIFLNADRSLEEVLSTILEHGYSRYPVYKEKIDNVVGVLYTKDLIRYLQSSTQEKFQLDRYCREPFFVPASKKLDSLLRDFKKRHVHMALVMDEYGGVSGLLCLEDIIEQIVGSIQDEFDNETEELHSLGEGHFMVDARIAIDELNQYLDLTLPNDNFDTFGGFLYNLFGRVPSLHQEIKYQNITFIAREVDGQKIKSVELIKDKTHEK